MPFKKDHKTWNKGKKYLQMIGNTYGFKKGQIPWNKGTKGICKSNSGSFKKGQTAPTKDRKFPERSRENSILWKGGITTSSQGYIFILNTEHLFCNSNGYVKRANLVMEKHLKRYLVPPELIHHINGIRIDDRLKNLKLFSNQSKHIKK